jgi:hypothetical protein
MATCLYLKRPLLADFHENRNMSTNLSRTPQCEIQWRSIQLFPSFYTFGRRERERDRERDDEADIHILITVRYQHPGKLCLTGVKWRVASDCSWPLFVKLRRLYVIQASEWDAIPQPMSSISHFHTSGSGDDRALCGTNHSPISIEALNRTANPLCLL